MVMIITSILFPFSKLCQLGIAQGKKTKRKTQRQTGGGRWEGSEIVWMGAIGWKRKEGEESGENEDWNVHIRGSIIRLVLLPQGPETCVFYYFSSIYIYIYTYLSKGPIFCCFLVPHSFTIFKDLASPRPLLHLLLNHLKTNHWLLDDQIKHNESQVLYRYFSWLVG